jgi:hypothetical protein
MSRPRSISTLARFAAEFVVIVIGVLAALAADGWREDRIDLAAEAEFLARLRGDLQADTAELAETQRRIAMKYAVLTSLSQDRLDPDDVDPTRLAADLAAATTWTWNFQTVHDVTFQELRSSGNLNLIRDAELRAQLSSYYSAYTNMAATVDAREPDFNALTYRLIPRQPPIAGVDGSDFDFTAGALSERQIDFLLSPEHLDQLQMEATAELNFSRYSWARAGQLGRLAARVLTQLNAYASR